MKSFIELGIAPPILKALEEMGFNEPTAVQERAIPHILNNEDLIVMSKTGSGKTAVFGVSILQLTDPEKAVPQGLILTPTRELAVQVDNDLKNMSTHLEHRTTAVYGQHSMNVEIQALKKGAIVVSGTPGRVFDHIHHGNLDTRNIRFFVLDEADRMLDMGFIGQVVKIIKTLPRNRVTLLFSATIPPEVKRICTDYMRNPVTIEIESQTKTVDTINQVYYRVNHNEKRTQLNRLLLIEQPESCLIFCNTRIAVDQVQNFLTRKGYASHALHGDIAQGTRMKTMDQFKQGNFHILVATDVAARGIHIDDLSLVINYDVPMEKDSYIHRIGRTGRAGSGGRAISLVTSDDIMSLYEIEEHIGALIEESSLPSEEVFNERVAMAESWLQANTLKNKPSQAFANGAAPDTSREFTQRRSSSPQRRSGSRPGRDSTAPRPDNRNRPISSEQQAKPEYQGKTDNRERNARNHRPNQQTGSETRTSMNQQEGRVQSSSSRQQTGSTRQEGYNRQSGQQAEGSQQMGYNRQGSGQQTGNTRQTGYNRQGADQQTSRQTGYNRQGTNQQAGNTRQAGDGQKKSGQQSKIGASSSTDRQDSFRNVRPSARPSRTETKPAVRDMQKNPPPHSTEPSKKESFLKRMFSRILGK